MSNHFHILVYVPEARQLDDAELFERIRTLYSGDRLEELTWERELCTKDNDAFHQELFRKRFLRRMYDVSAFMKTLKQNSTMSYNCRRVHTGTMRESRFRVREYLPDEKAALIAAAAYAVSAHSPARG